MTFIQILAVLRTRWSALVVGLLVGVGAASITTAFLPPSYASATSLYVRATDTGAGATSYTSNLLTQQLVKSYADLATSQRVLNAVIQQLGLNRSADDLASHVDAVVQQDSTILNVTVTDRSPVEAARLAEAVGAQLSTAVSQLEQQGSYSVELSVVDRPVVDDHAVSPRWPINLTVGAVLGLLLGVVLAAVRTATDRSVRSEAALAEAAGVRSLVVLPREHRTARRTPAPTAAYVAAVRRLRTTLQLAEPTTSSTVVTLGGPHAGIGTSTLARALASAIAPTRRVLLVEGDLRHPTGSGDPAFEATAGLSEVLTGTTTLDSAAQTWRGVDILSAGEPVDDSTALLSAPALGQLIESVRESYDLVLIDAPPLGPSLDGVLLARLSDLTVLTAQSGTTSTDEIAAAVEALRAEGVRVLGTVLTSARSRIRAADRSITSDSASEQSPAASRTIPGSA